MVYQNTKNEIMKKSIQYFFRSNRKNKDDKTPKKTPKNRNQSKEADQDKTGNCECRHKNTKDHKSKKSISLELVCILNQIKGSFGNISHAKKLGLLQYLLSKDNQVIKWLNSDDDGSEPDTGTLLDLRMDSADSDENPVSLSGFGKNATPSDQFKFLNFTDSVDQPRARDEPKPKDSEVQMLQKSAAQARPSLRQAMHSFCTKRVEKYIDEILKINKLAIFFKGVHKGMILSDLFSPKKTNLHFLIKILEVLMERVEARVRGLEEDNARLVLRCLERELANFDHLFDVTHFLNGHREHVNSVIKSSKCKNHQQKKTSFTSCS